MPFADPEKEKEYKRQHYLKNKEKVKAQHTIRVEDIAAYKKQYRQEHKAEIKAYNQEYLQGSPEQREKRAAYNREYRKNQRDRLKGYRKDYYQKTGG